MCQWITDTIKKAQDDGTWAKAFEATLGKSGVDTPKPPDDGRVRLTCTDHR